LQHLQASYKINTTNMILKWNPSLFGGIQVVAFDLEATSTIPNQTFIFKVYAERSDGEVFDSK